MTISRLLTLVCLHFATIFHCTIAEISAQQGENITEIRLEILSFNDVYNLQQDSLDSGDRGGASRVGAISQQMRKNFTNTLVVFAGDTLSPSLWSKEFKGLQMITGLNAIGVDYACIGNHEFDFGMDGFRLAVQASNFSWLNGNYYETVPESRDSIDHNDIALTDRNEIGTNNNITDPTSNTNDTYQLLRGTIPYAVKSLHGPGDGIKIGLFAVLYNMELGKSTLHYHDFLQAAKDQVASLREHHKVHFVIAVTHQDLPQDIKLQKEVKGIDMIIGGHDHDLYISPESKGMPSLIKNDFNFYNVWRTTITFTPQTQNSSIDIKPSYDYQIGHVLVNITKDLPTHAKIDTIIDNYEKQMDDLFGQNIGNICSDIDFRQEAVRLREAKAGNMYADAMIYAYAPSQVADVAIMNGGGLRTDRLFLKGSVSLGDVVSWSPFGNKVMIIETTARLLKVFIEKEMMGSCSPAADDIVLNGFYIHTAGFHYSFACAPGVDKEGHLTQFETSTGQVIDDSQELMLAISDYMYRRFHQVAADLDAEDDVKVIIHENEAIRMEAVLIDALERSPNRTLCPQLEGRTEVTISP
eukprot:CAMPEP_0197851570 /NCGR_PEP_ID=MMETSP1438-20131217/18366_1 /TAXON_ID=1461541 /ORGANISM="Pterosperma sp., Strain CCMP1384" /LENGTH=581 /DNA_ID=CAMNT_0043465207 /DNA_START=471 /DNA_END=2216 /DNA_ORIENTATION=+